MASKTMNQAEIERCVAVAVDVTDAVLPLPDAPEHPGYGESLEHQDRLELRREAFAQTLRAALKCDIT